MQNLQIWNSFNQPPKSALKQIEAGRMKGKTDINPQWRYKAMTETFGVVGLGWKFSIDKMWTEQGANNETFVFVNVSVYIKADGVWSDPIPGTGGATLIVSEKNGMYNDDDAFKKATTDALSTAMKMLGVAADIYSGAWDGAKYKDNGGVSQSDVSDKLWDHFQKVSDEAVKAGIPNVKVFDRSKTTKAELTAYGTELSEAIKAKAGK